MPFANALTKAAQTSNPNVRMASGGGNDNSGGGIFNMLRSLGDQAVQQQAQPYQLPIPGLTSPQGQQVAPPQGGGFMPQASPPQPDLASILAQLKYSGR